MSTAELAPGRPPARLKARRHASRQRKLACTACGFICYASAGAVIACGLPRCGCGMPLSVANPRDLSVIDPESFEQLAGQLPKAAHNAMMRAAGYEDMLIRDKGHDPAVARARAARQKRCAQESCGRFARKGSAHCAEHSGNEGMPF